MKPLLLPGAPANVSPNISCALEELGIIGRSHAFLSVAERLPMIAASHLSTLIIGETGTGKGLIAKALHYLGPRNGGPFVQVHCGTLNPNLIENELFGHAKGAFTGAVDRSPGLIARARRGVLFIDEVDVLPLESQGKILQLIEEGQYRLLGGGELQNSDTRIVAATNVDLSAAVTAGRFRRDLYFRLNAMTITIPPLRHRKEDIPLLIAHFLSPIAGSPGSRVKHLCVDLLGRMMRHSWPGNVRELKNCIESAAAMTRGHLITECTLAPGNVRSVPARARSLHDIEQETLAAVRTFAIREALSQAEGNIGLAARLLDIHRGTLYERMKDLGIKPMSPNDDRQASSFPADPDVEEAGLSFSPVLDVADRRHL